MAVGQRLAHTSAKRARSLGSVGLWSFVSGTGSIGMCACCPRPCGGGRVRARTARESPTQPVVSTRPLSVFCSTVRMAVEPEKRQSDTFCAIVADVLAKAKCTASLADLPDCNAEAAPASRLRSA